MQITKVSYSKKFPYAPYLNFDIGFEAQLDKNEDPNKVLDWLKQMAEQYYHSQTVFGTQAAQDLNDIAVPTFTFTGEKSIYPDSEPKTKLSPTELVLQEISHCTTQPQLKSLQLIANQHETTKSAYENKLLELSK